MGRITLSGLISQEENSEFVEFSGVISRNGSELGSNFNVQGIIKNHISYLASGEFGSSVTLSGKVWPIAHSSKMPSDIKMELKVNNSSLQIFFDSSFGDICFSGNLPEIASGNGNTGFMIDCESQNILAVGNLKDLCERHKSYKKTGSGKRLKLSFVEENPEPILRDPEYLGNGRIRVFWSVPVMRPGLIVNMSLNVIASSKSSKVKVQKSVNPVTSIIGTDILGTEIGKQRTRNSSRHILFAPIALQSCSVEVNRFDEVLSFSYVLDNLSVGKHELCVSVQVKQDCNENFENMRYSTLPKQNTYLYFVECPPETPSDLSVLIKKARTDCKWTDEADVIYEPYLLVSWKPPMLGGPKKLKRGIKHARAEGFRVGIEVFNLKVDKWQEFGEPTEINMSYLKSGLDKESCSLVALPEEHERSYRLFSKMRVFVMSTSKFGESAKVYSTTLDIPKLSEPSIAKVDFKNVEETTCVICAEEIVFEKEYLALQRDIKPICHFNLAATPCCRLKCKGDVPFKGIVSVHDKLFNSPVSPTCCSHVFHLKCLLDWSRSSKIRLAQELGVERAVAKCPLCMQQFKHVVTQVLDPEKQCDRKYFCADAKVMKRQAPRILLSSRYYPMKIPHNTDNLREYEDYNTEELPDFPLLYLNF